MLPQNRKTRISTLLPTDRVLVECLTEPLQDLFEKMQDCTDELRRVRDSEGSQEKKSKDFKKYFLANQDDDRARMDFWLAVRTHYDLWEDQLCIRDGYAIVEPKENLSNDIFKKIFGGG